MTIFIPSVPLLRKYMDSFQSLAGAPDVITGLGFKPKALIFISSEATGLYNALSIGFDDAVWHICKHKMHGDNPWEFSADHSIYVVSDPGHVTTGYVTSLDDDGFTVTWDSSGGFIVNVMFLAIG